MRKFLLVVVLATLLGACGAQSSGGSDVEARLAALEAAKVETPPQPPPPPPPSEDDTDPQPEATNVDSGVIHEYCVNITFVTHFQPGTTPAQVRTFADSIMQRLCVDGAPRTGSTQGRDRVPATGQEIEWTATYR